jgi:hypothetical protein
MLRANDGVVGKKALFFMDEIKQNLNDDLTLTKFQKDLFIYYFDKHHRRFRRFLSLIIKTFYWALFIYLICLWFSFSWFFEFIYKYILTPIRWSYVEGHMVSAIGDYTHVIAIFLVIFVFVLVVMIVVSLALRCWKTLNLVGRKAQHIK